MLAEEFGAACSQWALSMASVIAREAPATAADDLQCLKVQVGQLKERVDFIAAMVPFVSLVQEFFQKVECEASVQLTRLKDAHGAQVGPAGITQLETVKWVHVMTNIMMSPQGTESQGGSSQGSSCVNPGDTAVQADAAELRPLTPRMGGQQLQTLPITAGLSGSFPKAIPNSAHVARQLEETKTAVIGSPRCSPRFSRKQFSPRVVRNGSSCAGLDRTPSHSQTSHSSTHAGSTTDTTSGDVSGERFSHSISCG